MATKKKHLTHRVIDNLTLPLQGRDEYPDDEVRGLRLFVTAKGAKTFYLVKKFRGKSEHSLIGHYPERSIKAARARAMALRSQYDQGQSPLAAKALEQQDLTLDAFYAIYDREHLEKTTRRPEKNRAEYRRYLSPTLGSLRLSEITRGQIISLMHRIGDDEAHPRTANIVHTIIRAILNKALIWDYLEGRNPADHIVRYPEKKRRRYLAKEELPRFHRALKQESNETNRDAILILLYTGARKMNVLAMQWKDIDLDRAIWIIPETKNGEPQMVVLPMQAITLLKRRYKQRHFRYVFPGQGQAGHLGNLKKAWERLLDNAGIDDLWIHDLRRTVGSYLANFGASQDQIKMQLGHKDAQSLAHYVFPDPEYLRATVAELANFLEKSTLDEE